MSDPFTDIHDRKKDRLIGKLLDRGIYKTRNLQLYELSLKELEHEYRKLTRVH